VNSGKRFRPGYMRGTQTSQTTLLDEASRELGRPFDPNAARLSMRAIAQRRVACQKFRKAAASWFRRER